MTTKGAGVRLMIAVVVTAIAALPLAHSDPKIASITTENGKVKMEIEGPAGEYIVQSRSSLSEGSWTQLCRHGSNGSTKVFDDPIDSSGVKFFRVLDVAANEAFHLTGEFAAELNQAALFSDISNVFGFGFLVEEAVIPGLLELSSANRNARSYAASIAVLSKLAEDIRDGFPPGSRPSAATVVAALAEDIVDGRLDGRNNGGLVAIGSTGSNLPAISTQDFNDSLNHIKGVIPGLYNVNFTAAGDGSFSVSIPAVWCDFYWGSSVWQ